MKLVYLINGLGTGGAERSLAELLPFYTAAGIESVVVCQHLRSEGVEQQLRSAGFDLRVLTSRRFPARILEFRALIRSERADLVHTTIFESDVLGRLAAAATDVPVLSSLVNTSYTPMRLADPNVPRLRLWAVRVIDAWTGRYLTTHFHAITHAVKDAAVRALGIAPERITVIERGRDPRRLGQPGPARRRRAREALGLRPDDEVLVTVGRQEIQKGQAYLLEAIAALARTRPRLVLLLAGRTGHASLELHRIHERLRLGDRVRFLGHRDDVPELLAAADLFVFPSLYEGLGCSVLEAMALGLPVVASDIPALREVVEDGQSAVLVRPAAPDALAAAVDHLLSAPLRAAAFGRRGIEIFAERFTLERSAARMVRLYREVAPDPRSLGQPAGAVARTCPPQSGLP
ncbi:MAG: glycosyltransferase family 4 protein [Gemmatimonadales bacterium]